jgi:hypothetical protein
MEESTMNADYEWGGSLFRTRNDMLDAIAELAAEAIAGWGLDCGTGWCGEGEPHMTRYGYDAKDLAAAFGRVRELLGEVAPEA